MKFLLFIFFVSILGFSAEKPNIVFLIVDDLGYGDLAVTGHPFIETPNLDRLAHSGAQFKNFYSPASICSPSRASMMTGRMPYRLGIYSFIYNGGGYVHLRKSETTFPQLLQKAGYQTALIGKWHVSHNDVQKKHNLPTMKEYGFDYSFTADNNTIIKNKPGWWKNGKNIGIQKGLAADVVARETINWLINDRKEKIPFMLCVHFYEPHWLVTGPDRLVTKYATNYRKAPQRAHYPACIENVDTRIGDILTTLKKLQLDKNTVVIFTSDHGPASFDKGRGSNRNDGRATPYKGHKYGLWDGSVHVPGFIVWPGVTKSGQKIKAPAGGIDFLPTVCQIAGLTIPDSLKLDGVSFVPLLKGDKIKRKTSLQWHHYNSTLKDKSCPRASLRRGNLLIAGWYATNKAEGQGRWYPKNMTFLKNSKLVKFKLYNLSNDLSQKSDVSKAYAKEFNSMKKELVEKHIKLQKEAYGWEREAK